MKAHNISKGKTKNQNIDEELRKAYDKKCDVKIDAVRQKLWLPKTWENRTQYLRNTPNEADDAQYESPLPY